MPKVRVGYCTDAEGNLEWFRKYVEVSEVLVYEANDALALVDDEAFFVFGGDAVDKGNGDLRLCRSLADLKKRYPERVFLLVGNRDLNKLRMTSELSAAAMQLSPAEVPRPHWDDDVPSYEEYLGEKDDTRPMRLKWMLQHTLGCPETFEHRRSELALLRGQGVSADVSVDDAAVVSDEAVVDSFVSEVMPGGALRDYLENADVAVRLGITLFVHGAVDTLTAGYVPPVTTPFRKAKATDLAYPPGRRFFEGPGSLKPDAWIRGLNDLLKEGLEDHQKTPLFYESKSSLVARDPHYYPHRGGEALMALQNRASVWGRSIVSNCYCDGGNPDSPEAADRRQKKWREVDLLAADVAPTVFEAATGYTSDCRDPDVAKWLLDAGIRRVVVGHRPTGDSPAILSSKFTGVELVSADTSYSDVRAPDNRGLAVPAVTIEGDSHDVSRTRIHGILKDGRPYEALLPALGGCDHHLEGDLLLGTEDHDGWWYKATLDDGNRYLQCKGAGRRVQYRDIPRPGASPPSSSSD